MSQRVDEPGLGEALDPGPRQRDRLAEEEEAVVPVLLDAGEGAAVEAEDRLRQRASLIRRVSGSTAASSASSWSSVRSRRRLASQAVRFDLTDRRTRWPSAVRVRPTRRLSPATGSAFTRPASS